MGLGSEYGVESEDTEAIDRGFAFLPFVFAVLGFIAMRLLRVHPWNWCEIAPSWQCGRQLIGYVQPEYSGKSKTKSAPKVSGARPTYEPKVEALG